MTKKLPLFFLLGFLFTRSIFSQVLEQEVFKTHLRWNLAADKSQVNIINGKTAIIETLNLAVFDKMVQDLAKISLEKSYVKNLSFSKENFPQKPARILIELANDSVELFSFYREVEDRFILDFWINLDQVSKKTAALKKTTLHKKVKTKSLKAKANKTVNQLKNKSKVLEKIIVAEKFEKPRSRLYKDYRYGASFYWDYDPYMPSLEKDILLSSKTPEYLYPIKDRELLDDKKEAHMQLSINFYRKEKWGLMNKSIRLYENKYGDDKHKVLNLYLKANALLKKNLKEKNHGIKQASISMLEGIVERTDDYEMKNAVYRYTLQYYLDRNDYIKSLEVAKNFFVEARAVFDQDMVIYTSKVILQALASLRQLDKINDFLGDKKLASILPKQIELAYSSFVYLQTKREKELVTSYEKVENSLVKPVHPAILFNTAEAYFRKGDLKKALKLYDEFAKEFSHEKESSQARLRIALIYELSQKKSSQVISLYKNAIDRSPYPKVRYEAKLRYVGYRLARKNVISPSDLETEVFLEQSADEKAVLTSELKELLWQVRLRVFLNQEKFTEALTYLESIPLQKLQYPKRMVFLRDGAEAAYGHITKIHELKKYSQVAKEYKLLDKKFGKEFSDIIQVQFLLADSYIKMGLFTSFDRVVAQIRNTKQKGKEFPLWVPRQKSSDPMALVDELEIKKLAITKKWGQLEDKLASIPVAKRNPVIYPYYKGSLYFQRDKFSEAAKEFEKVLLSQTPQNKLNQEEMADFLMTYIESLYEMKDVERFKKVATALLKDINRSKSASILNISERVTYLLIETAAGEKNTNYKELEKMSEAFLEKFQKSPYISRIKYLLGVSFLRNDKLEKGKTTLTELISDKEVPGYIREMARTELSSEELKGKNI